MLSELSQTKYYMVSLTRGIKKKKTQMNLHTKQKQIHRCRKETMVTEEEERG